MKNKSFLICLLTFISLSLLFVIGYFSYDKKLYADMVMYGNIYTGIDDENFREAIAIKDDEIIFVGNKNDVNDYINDNTIINNYNDGIILSGFTDTHTHVMPSIGAKEFQFDLSDAYSIEEYVNIITDYINNNPDLDMYVGRGWNCMLFDNGIPTKDILDNISLDKPIFIKSNDGHAGWINSKMIEIIGVDSNTENPLGGIVIKDENNEPVGCFRDAAMDVYIKPFIKPYSIDEYKKLILNAQMFYAEMGYSSYVEVFVENDEVNYNMYKAYEELDKENKLILRVQGAWNVGNNSVAISKVNDLIKYKNESKGGMFELTDVKIFMDGVAETGTAYFSEPYANDINNYGADRWPSEDDFSRLVDIITLANKNDLVVHFHAIGDAAITKALDAVEEARKNYINKNIHNVITHLEIVKDSDIKRFKDLDIVISADLSWGCKVDILYSTVEEYYLGEKRAATAYPYKSVLDAGAVVSMATDYPAGVFVSPLAAYIVAVTRNLTDNEENVRDASQKMTKVEALNAITYGGAYQMRQNNIRGTLEVGKKADITILDRNLFEEVSTYMLNTNVVLNMVNGKIIYKR